MKTVIQDTADVIITDIITGKVIVNAEATVAGVSQSINEEDLRGGIGNKVLFKIRSDKTIELNMGSALFDIEYLALTQGVSVDEAGTASVTKVERLKVGALDTVTIVGTALNNTARVTNSAGEQEEVAVATKSITMPVDFAAEGEEVTVTYLETVVGNKVSLDASKFSSKYKIEYRTISYDVKTAAVYSDIYFVFHEAIPNGSFDLSLQNGTAYSPEISFTVTTPIGSDEMGLMLEVPRVVTP